MTTRRDFVKRSVAASALVGLNPAAAAAATARADDAPPSAPVDYYDKLGVTKIINAAGTYTYLTASVMPTQVQDAITVASRHNVRLAELQAAAGAYIAKRLQCEAALVSAGAASALSLGAAGCMTVGNADGPRDVPIRTSGFKNEFIIQKAHRFPHEHGLEMAGMKLVEVETLEEYERAFTPQTGVAFFFNAAEVGPGALQQGVKGWSNAPGASISREDWIRVAREHNVPTFLDAAADVPPISNLWNYTKMGFDLVTFSGGKGIRGPQNAGLLLGRKDLIAAAAANDCPNDRSIGRGMKVAKEQIVGMVAALDCVPRPDRRGDRGGGPPACRGDHGGATIPADRHYGDLHPADRQPRAAPHDPLRPEPHRHQARRRRRCDAQGHAIDRAQSGDRPRARCRRPRFGCEYDCDRPMDDEPGRGRDRGAQAARSPEGGVAAAGLKAERWG